MADAKRSVRRVAIALLLVVSGLSWGYLIPIMTTEPPGAGEEPLEASVRFSIGALWLFLVLPSAILAAVGAYAATRRWLRRPRWLSLVAAQAGAALAAFLTSLALPT